MKTSSNLFRLKKERALSGPAKYQSIACVEITSRKLEQALIAVFVAQCAEHAEYKQPQDYEPARGHKYPPGNRHCLTLPLALRFQIRRTRNTSSIKKPTSIRRMPMIYHLFSGATFRRSIVETHSCLNQHPRIISRNAGVIYLMMKR